MYIKAQFQHSHTKEFRGIAYTYKAEDEFLQVGDELEIETKYGRSRIKVTEIRVPEAEIITLKDSIKTIPKKTQIELEFGEE